MFEKIIDSIKTRIRFLFAKNDFNFIQKCKIISHRNYFTGSSKFIESRISENDEYYSINNMKIYYHSKKIKINDKNRLKKAIKLVLGETFLFPSLFYDKVFLNEDDIVLDVGASIGTTALYLSKYCKNGKIYAIEPVTSDVIENNINNVSVINKGVSDKCGFTEIETSDFCLDSSISHREDTNNYFTKKIKIELITIDQMVQDLNLNKINFIKMDIEGVEELALRGARKTLKQFRPKLSIASYHIDFNNELQHNKLVSLLKEYGYNIKEKGTSHIYAW